MQLLPTSLINIIPSSTIMTFSVVILYQFPANGGVAITLLKLTPIIYSKDIIVSIVE